LRLPAIFAVAGWFGHPRPPSRQLKETGHPRLAGAPKKAWMPGTSPGRTARKYASTQLDSAPAAAALGVLDRSGDRRHAEMPEKPDISGAPLADA
jgi:hypothetical protein